MDFAAPVDYVSPVKDETISPASPDGPDDVRYGCAVRVCYVMSVAGVLNWLINSLHNVLYI